MNSGGCTWDRWKWRCMCVEAFYSGQKWFLCWEVTGISQQTHNKMLTKTKLALCCANLFRNCLSCQLANSHSHLNGLKIQDRSRKMLKSPQISESALALITSASWWMYMSVSIKSRLMLMCSRNGLRWLCYDNLTLTKTVLSYHKDVTAGLYMLILH